MFSLIDDLLNYNTQESSHSVRPVLGSNKLKTKNNAAATSDTQNTKQARNQDQRIYKSLLGDLSIVAGRY